MTSQAMADLRARYPEVPRPVPAVDSQEWRNFMAARDAWIKEEDELQKAETPKVEDTPGRKQPHCAPRSEDAYFRGPLGRWRIA